MGRLHRMLILKACPYQQILSSKGAETTNGTASQHIHINKYVDLPDGSTIQIVDSGPLFTFLVIPKQQNGTRVLYDICVGVELGSGLIVMSRACRAKSGQSGGEVTSIKCNPCQHHSPDDPLPLTVTSCRVKIRSSKWVN